MDDIAIKVDNVSKVFKLPHEKNNSVKSAVVNFYRRDRTFEVHRALKNVSFEIKKGEFVGIIGRNGGGKSTLLRILAGIYAPTKGQVTVNGSLTPFIELGVGFNPELTGRENVFLNGALLGFNRREVRAMYDDIVSFAELENFMDQKLKNYSSGMEVRLAFSVAIRAHSDILLIDEVLAVGDERFQDKCLQVFDQSKGNGKTIIFVSHSMDQIKHFCDRAIVLDQGQVVFEGTSPEAAMKYTRLNFPEATTNLKYKGDNGLRVRLAKVNGREAKSTILKQGDRVTFDIEWPKDDAVKNAGVAIFNDAGHYIFGANTILDNQPPAGNRISYEVELNLGGGDYFAQVGLFGNADNEKVYFVDKAITFKILNPDKWQGITHLDHKWIA